MLQLNTLKLAQQELRLLVQRGLTHPLGHT